MQILFMNESFSTFLLKVFQFYFIHGTYFIQSFSYFALTLILLPECQINFKNVHTVAEIALYKSFIIHFSVMISDQTFFRRRRCNLSLFLSQLIS